MAVETHCPLCDGEQLAAYSRDRYREYLQCGDCELVFVPAESRLSLSAERAVYDLHNNRVDDPGYRGFLSRLSTPLMARLPPPARGLDFGCGPGPALAHMLEEAGYSVAVYDPYYAPGEHVLARSYDFVTATEVVEHLHRPGWELERLWSLLEPGGWLGVMTKRVLNRAAFDRWHYRNDPTHVCFFSIATWQWWAARHDIEPEFPAADVVLLQRQH